MKKFSFGNQPSVQPVQAPVEQPAQSNEKPKFTFTFKAAPKPVDMPATVDEFIQQAAIDAKAKEEAPKSQGFSFKRHAFVAPTQLEQVQVIKTVEQQAKAFQKAINEAPAEPVKTEQDNEVSQAIAYIEGEEAQNRGQTRADNPYPLHTNERAEWDHGYRDAEYDKEIHSAELESIVDYSETEEDTVEKAYWGEEYQNNGEQSNEQSLAKAVQENYGLASHIVLDNSQRAAIEGLVKHQFGCITGAAGTGKTTIERAVLHVLERQIGEVDLSNYGKTNPDMDAKADKRVAIALCAYTGMAVQQQKRAVPTKYARHCYTIHRLLGYHPEYFEEEYGDEVKMVRRFVPLYGPHFKMPWRVIILDEGSMIPIDLWNIFIAACRDDCRIYIIGDINQLPPIHGKSVFGYALLNWPSYELTTIHRQKGENNPIVDNAWNILAGIFPDKVENRFDMFMLPSKEFEQQNFIVQVMVALKKKEIFNPVTTEERKGDMLIVSQNVGNIGQEELNSRLIPFFNPPPLDNMSPQETGRRITIVAGFEKPILAVGDKVMNTKNDYELGVTNGMTGQIIEITRNGNYKGKLVDTHVSSSMVNDMLTQLNEGTINIDNIEVMDEEDHNKTLAADPMKRQASHIVKVDFGYDDDGTPIIIEFSTAGQVNALQLAWAATCHKCQGSEYPVVVIVCSNKNWRMLCREWLYTAVTRASQRVVLLYDDRGITRALNTQRIQGRNLREKAETFNRLQEEASKGNASHTMPVLPKPKEL